MKLAYGVTLILFSIYSYALIDPNLTLLGGSVWESFRNIMVYLGYHERSLSSILYLLFISSLLLFHLYFIRRSHLYKPFQIALIVATCGLIAYPFLSHDFFNYIFDAKIVTVYHENPYLKRALDFPDDNWLRFMHWTHRTYPYGPVFLPLSLIPSFLAMGKLILNFLFFKAMYVGFYLGSVYFLQKIQKRWAMIFATSPLIFVEGLMNNHNDFIALSLACIGFYFLERKAKIIGRLFLLLSGGIKYITLPLVLLHIHKKRIVDFIAIGGVLALVTYLSFYSEVQPWYFLALFTFFPFFELFSVSTLLFQTGLLISYYPFIRYGDWTAESLATKHLTVTIFLGANILYYFLIKRKK